jgi:hypothetical protein
MTHFGHDECSGDSSVRGHSRLSRVLARTERGLSVREIVGNKRQV